MDSRIVVHLVGWISLAITVGILAALSFLGRWVFHTYGMSTGLIFCALGIIFLIGIAALLDKKGWPRRP